MKRTTVPLARQGFNAALFVVLACSPAVLNIHQQPEISLPGQIEATGSMATPRSAHTATLLPNGTVLITGGMAWSERDHTASAERYDPVSGTFRHTGSMATTRVSHTATLLPNGTVLIAGGIKSDERTRAEVYDPATGAFSPTGRMLEKRYGHTATLLRNGNVLIVGGLGPGWTFLGRAEIYDPATGTFTSTGSMTTLRASHTATLLDDGTVLITGGHRGRRSSQQLFSSAEVYDPVTGTFAPTGSMNVIRHKHEAVRLQNGHVLVLGGSNEKDGRGRYKSAEVYDPRSGTFTLTGEMPSARFKIKGTVVLMPDGTVLVAGGAARADLYDPESRSFSQVPGTLETALLFSTATLLANGTVLITGGYDHTITSHASAWVYRP